MSDIFIHTFDDGKTMSSIGHYTYSNDEQGHIKGIKCDNSDSFIRRTVLSGKGKSNYVASSVKLDPEVIECIEKNSQLLGISKSDYHRKALEFGINVITASYQKMVKGLSDEEKEEQALLNLEVEKEKEEQAWLNSEAEKEKEEQAWLNSEAEKEKEEQAWLNLEAEKEEEHKAFLNSQ